MRSSVQPSKLPDENKENIIPIQAHYQHYLQTQAKTQKQYQNNQNEQSLPKQSSDFILSYSCSNSIDQNSLSARTSERNVGNKSNRSIQQKGNQRQQQKPTPSFKSKTSPYSYKPQQNKNSLKKPMGTPQILPYEMLNHQIQTTQQAHYKNQPSISSTTSAQINKNFQTTNKHLRFDSVNSSSVHSRHQILSIASHNFHALMTPSQESQQEYVEDELDSLADKEVNISQSLKKNGDESEQEEVPEIQLIHYPDQEWSNCNSSSIQQHVSALKEFSQSNNDVKVLASLNSNAIEYISYQPNFVECSPSVNSQGDRVYSNSNLGSSAAKSVLTISSAFKNGVESISGSRRKFKDEDFNSNEIKEQAESEFGSGETSSKDIHFQLSQENEIEDRLRIPTNSSKMHHIQTQSDEQLVLSSDGGSQSQVQSPSQWRISDQIQPASKRQTFQDAIDDTPQMMKMFNRQSDLDTDQNLVMGEEDSPEILGGRDQIRSQRHEIQAKEEDNHIRTSARYLFFKDISPLIKSSNTFQLEQTQYNQTTNDINDTTGFLGKVSPTYLKALEINAKSLGLQKQQNQNEDEDDLLNADSRVSSLLESPPALTESSGKGIKDFTRQYLKAGIWPSGESSSRSRLSEGFQSCRSVDPHLFQTKMLSQLNSQIHYSYKQNKDNSILDQDRSKMYEGLNSSEYYNMVGSQHKPFMPLLNFTNAVSTADRTQPNSSKKSTHDFNFFQNNPKVKKGNTFYFKRPSDHVGIGAGNNSSLAYLRKQREQQQCNYMQTSTSNYYEKGVYQLTGASNTLYQSTCFEDQYQAQGQRNACQMQTDFASAKHCDQRSNESSCPRCQLESEKRAITQTAFEQALGISVYLMEEIERLKCQVEIQNRRPSVESHGHPPSGSKLAQSKQQLSHLINFKQLHPPLTSQISPRYCGGSPDMSHLNRSISQKHMMKNLGQVQRSVQLPQGAPRFFTVCPSSSQPNNCSQL